MKTITPFIQYRLPVIAWAILIYFLSSLPGSKIPPLVMGTDKIVHAGIYAVLCWLCHVAFRFQKHTLYSSMSLFIALVLTTVYGISDEFHQSFIPGRTAGFDDVAADCAGALVYIFFAMRYKLYSQR